MFITHTTLQTAHSRNSERSEISEEALEFCTELITSCLLNQSVKVPITIMDGFYLSAGNIEKSTLFGTVWFGEVPLVSFAVVREDCDAEGTWELLHEHSTLKPTTKITEVPAIPFIAVTVQISAVGQMDFERCLGDFERCLAWAWVLYK